MIGLGIPYIALRNVSGDSGFIETVEPLAYMNKHYGVVSAVYVDGDIDEDAKWPGSGEIPAVYPPTARLKPRQDSYRYGLDVDIATRIFPGQASSPVDFIFTNRRYVAHTMVASSYDFRLQRHMVPVILDVLKTGMHTHDIVTPELLKYEAMSYASADRIIFSTELERSYGLTIVKRHMAPSVVREVEKKAMVIADGISDILKDIAPTSKQLAKKLQTPKTDSLRIIFAGRMSSSKGADKILAVMRPLFALHNLKLTLITQSFDIPKHKPEWKDVHCFLTDSMAKVGKEKFLRDVVAKSDLFLNASLTGGYAVTVAEAIYAGVPVLLPYKPWATAMVEKDYPFFYDTKEQMYTLVNLIKLGKVTDQQVTAFDKTRKKFAKELCSQSGESLYHVIKEEVDIIDQLAQKEPHSRVLEHLFEKWEIGTIMPISRIGKMYPHPRLRVWNGFDNFFLYKYLKPYVEPVSFDGCMLKRIR
jgi:glycosyltransferase involved in cell wall biosynthesis